MGNTSETEFDDWLPLDAIRDTFAALVTGPCPVSVDGRAFDGLPDRAVPLDELRDLLMRRGCPTRLNDEVWRHLIARSRTERGTWTVACAGMALPMLAGQARWFGARFRGDRADAHAAVVAGFVEAVASIDLGPDRLVPRLRWRTRRAAQAALEESLDAPVPVATAFRSAPPPPPAGHPDFVLAGAVAAGVLTRVEADLIGATRLEGRSVADWALEHEATLKATYSARARAERRLVAYLRDEALDAAQDDPVAASALTPLAVAEWQGQPDIAPGLRLALSGRRPNGRAAQPDRLPRLVRKNRPESGLLRCGDPTSPDRVPSSEVPRCA